ncbi:MAG TPA: hypothetical protein VKZ60_08405 [Chloroflexota bacterium]|jgi:hypothetical protein|nr:hypothetical protein [Chloroflexota bacterium]
MPAVYAAPHPPEREPRCLLCGEPLPPAEAASAQPAAPILVRCAACEAEQVLGGPPDLCDGERAALHHALRYLRRHQP